MRKFAKLFLMLGVAMLALVACEVVAPTPEPEPKPEPPIEEQPPVDEPAKATFAIKVEEVHAASVVTQVTPSDTEMFSAVII